MFCVRDAFVVVLIALSLSGCANESDAGDWNRGERVFRIVLLPDTQCYSLYYPEIFESQRDWIVANVEELDIRGVVHLGDVTEHNTTEQWMVAGRSLLPIFDRIPAVVVPGNHDFGVDGSASSRQSNMSTQFSLDVLGRGPGFVGSFEMDPWNTAVVVRGDKFDFVIVGLEFAPRQAAVAWAQSILDSHPDHIGVLATHAFLDGRGERYNHAAANLQPFCPYDYGVASEQVLDGEELWQTLISPSDNARLVLSGHVPNGFAHRMDASAAGHGVQQVMADYQTGILCPNTGGDGRGYLLVLELEEGEAAIDVVVRSYSPYDGRFRSEHSFEFTIEAPM